MAKKRKSDLRDDLVFIDIDDAQDISPKKRKSSKAKNKDSSVKKQKSLPRFVFAIGGAVIIVGLIQIVITLKSYHDDKVVYDESIQQFMTLRTGEEIIADDMTELQQHGIAWYEMVNVDVVAATNINNDVLGWIYFEDGEINYPLLQGLDNEKYLDKAYDGTTARAGSIFMDCNNSSNFEDMHSLIYGHNMKNGAMFGKLRNYRKDDYYGAHKYFQIITREKHFRYEIFACADIADDSFIYDVDFDDKQQFGDFIGKIKEISIIKPDVTVTADDRILTLSTCSSTNRRLIVSAVLVDEH